MPNHIKEKNKFQPRKNALNNWLRTRKQTIVAYGYVLPGFFSTHLFFWDALFSLLGFSIEIGIFIFFLQQVEVSDPTNWAALLIVMVVDFLCIFLVHIDKSAKVKYENAVLFLNENEPSNPLTTKPIPNTTILASHYSITFKKIVSYIGVLLEVCACAIKLYFLNAAYGLSFEPISYGIVVGYILQTFFYIVFAGYFLWNVITNAFISRQYSRYRNLDGTIHPYMAQEYNILFSTRIKLLPKSNDVFTLLEDNVKTDQEKQKLDKGEQLSYHYKLSCIGIPLDADLGTFAHLQEANEARKEMMIFTHRLQLEKFASMN